MSLRGLPNGLTILRILLCPLLFYLILEANSLGDYLIVYYLFLIAGLTDVYDGTLARRNKDITTFGKLVDPIADKLLLAATIVPFYMLSAHVEICRHVTLPVLVILLGREVVVTALRYYSMWAGHIFSASRLAKFKTVSQMLFIGSVMVHLFHHRMILEHPHSVFSHSWFDPFHDRLNEVLILIVVGLSVVSALEYFVKNLPAILKKSSV